MKVLNLNASELTEEVVERFKQMREEKRPFQIEGFTFKLYEEHVWVSGPTIIKEKQVVYNPNRFMLEAALKKPDIVIKVRYGNEKVKLHLNGETWRLI